MTINVTNIQPLPGDPLGIGAAISFDVTFDPPTPTGDILVRMSFVTSFETVWDGSGFLVPYAGSSQRSVIPGGYHYIVRRSGGWPKFPGIDVQYVGGVQGGSTLSWKAAVKAVYDTNINLASAPIQADTVAVALNDRLAVKGQTDKTQNGIYYVASTVDGIALLRASDFDSSADIALGAVFRVLQGERYGGRALRLSSPVSGVVTIGITEIEFALDTDIEEVPFSRPLTIRYNQISTVEASDITPEGRVVLEFADTGHDVGGIRIINIPAGLTETALGDDAIARGTIVNDQDWPTYDPDQDATITIVCTSVDPLRFASTLILQGTPDAVAPTLTSAEVDATDPDLLVLNLSESCALRDLTGLSLDVQVGAAVTFTGVILGDGTNQPSLPLSRDIIVGDEIDLIIDAGRTLQDLNTNKIGTGTHAITLTGFNYTAPGQIHRYRGDVMGLSGTDVISLNDQVSTVHLAPGVPKPQLVTSGAGRQGWKFVTAGQYLFGDRASVISMTSGTILLVWRTTNVAVDYEAVYSLGSTGGVTATSSLNHGSTATLLARRDPVGGAADLSVAGPGTVLAADCITWDANSTVVYRNNNNIGSNAVAFSVGNIQRIALGIYSNLTSNGAHGVEQFEVIVCNQKLTALQVADFHAYAQSYHGTP